MKTKTRILFLPVMIFAFVFIVSLNPAVALQIYVIGTGWSQITKAINDLTTLGHTVTNGNTLADYSGYDQVWDLRPNVNLGSADVTAMGAFLAGGGSMYLTGENDSFDSYRNISLVNWIDDVGGGSLTLYGWTPGGSTTYRTFTTEGEALLNNNPNYFTSIGYMSARTISATGNGFLVTETSTGSGVGSLVGWDFGDIVGAPNARMLVGFDIEIFNNCQNWTENMSTYLVNPVPEPAAMILLAFGLIGLAGLRRKFKK